MERRSWPWKKKSTNKSSNHAEPIEALLEYHDQTDERIRHLSERLIAADDLVKQHVKVAEEAVSGWEKTKAEYVSVRDELDSALEQKQATEVRVFHLDGALKECMQQLRQAREEQEQRIHEAIVKKTRDWENLRLELEERLSDADGQLVEARRQNGILYKTVQEQAEAIAELRQLRSHAEGEAEVLQGHIQTMEKDKLALECEVTFLKKELDIRNQEREINKRATDMASRQQMDDAKHIAKLEAESEKLRALVRKKLPGPGALLQMRLEADGLDADGGITNGRRSSGRAVKSARALGSQSMPKSPSKLTERVSAKGHFQKSPRWPSKDPESPIVESPISSSVSKEPSQASMSEDGLDDERSVADSWVSALTELACFEKNKSSQRPPNEVQHSHRLANKLDSIDDFMEMERLVSLPSEQLGMGITTERLSSSMISKQVLAKEAELQAANDLGREANRKLALAEEQLRMLESKSTAIELNLFSLQQKLGTILEDPEQGIPDTVADNLKSVLLASRRILVDGLQAHLVKLPGHQNDSTLSSSLTSAVAKLVHIVEDLASESMSQNMSSKECQPNGGVGCIKSLEFDTSVARFTNISNIFLHGKAQVLDFIEELSSVLSQIKKALSLKASGRLKWRPDTVQVVEQDVFSEVGSPISLTSNSDGSDRLVAKAQSSTEDMPAGSRSLSMDQDLQKVRAEKAALESHMRAEFSRMASVEQMLANVKQEKLELVQKLEEKREEFEKKREEVEGMKSRLQHVEQLVADLRVRLASAELCGNVAERNLSSVVAEKAKLEAQLKDSQSQMHAKVTALEREEEELRLKVGELQALLHKATTRTVEDDGENITKKEQDIAYAKERLAECQWTILALGKQLKSIKSAKEATMDYQNQESSLKDHGFDTTLSSLQKVKQRVSSDPGFENINEADLSISGVSSPTNASYDLFTNKSDALVDFTNSDRQLVLHSPKPSLKMKNILPFLGTDTSNSSPEPSASPRKHGSSLSRFFTRHKNAS